MTLSEILLEIEESESHMCMNQKLLTSQQGIEHADKKFSVVQILAIARIP